MTLRPLSDLSPADWFVDADAPAWTKICLGPPGFEAYARVSYLQDDEDEYLSEAEMMGAVLDALVPRTGTPDHVFVGIWPGWGHWDRRSALDRHLPRLSICDGSVELRDYVLLEGPADDALTHESLGVDPAYGGAPAPHLLWPADHAWFVASDVDPDWFAVGGDQATIDEVLALPGLVSAPSAYDASDWESR